MVADLMRLVNNHMCGARERAVFDILDVAEMVERAGEFKFSLVAAYPQLPSPLWLI